MIASEQRTAGGASTRLSGWRLTLARAIWLALVVPSVALFVASLPVFDAQIQQPCTNATSCNIAGSLTPEGMRDLQHLGWTPGAYAAAVVVIFIFIVGVWSGIGFLIFWRRSDEWFALVVAFFLVMFNPTYPGFPLSALALVAPILNIPILLMGALGLASLALFLALFPNGKLASRWLLPFVLLAILNTVSSDIPPTLQFDTSQIPEWVRTATPAVVSLITFGPILGSQIYRYARLSTPLERQQTKWVVFGITAVLFDVFVVVPVFGLFFPSLINLSNTPLTELIGLATYPLVLLSLPVTVGIAVLRFHLYDVDLIIKRTLVYGALIAALALVYFALIFGLESASRLLTGNHGQSPVIIVISTLAIAALFEPFRRNIQRFIDRRFYRRNYDAARAIGAFSATLRSEVDLRQLQEQLLTVVEETMQPASLSLWLRTQVSAGAQRGLAPPAPEQRT
jgi:hypothetical protein